MKVIIETRTENRFGFEEKVGYSVLTPENQVRCYNMNECPEDATLNRDLGFVYSIPTIIKEAYEAGKQGEELVFTYQEEED